MTVQIFEGDCRDVLADLRLQRTLLDGALTDPPYGIESINKRFGSETAAPAKFGRDGAFGRYSENFMGQTWDDGVAAEVDVWRAVYHVLKPGAFVLAFANPATGYRQAMAMELAGLKHYPFLAWAFSQGAPKPHPAGDGVFYGSGVMRPGLEPIYMAQKPISEKTFKANIAKWGVGGIDIQAVKDHLGSDRWPTTLLLDGSDEIDRMFPIPETFIRVRHNRKATAEDRAGVPHPTVKPIALMRTLVTAVAPLGATIIDPFAGSGTTGEAARREGRSAILIEKSPQYAEGIRARFARQHRRPY